MAHRKKSQAPSWSAPKQFEEYRLLWQLGRGGMGEVYLGHDTLLERPVAIKFISAIEPDALMREQFLTEARAAARLQHPNVVTVYRVGEIERRPFIISEFVRGQNLDHVKLPMPWTRALTLGIGMARGLAAAHRRGVLHRDIKPGNVILAADGEIKLLDFGLAKFIEAGLMQDMLPDEPEQPRLDMTAPTIDIKAGPISSGELAGSAKDGAGSSDAKFVSDATPPVTVQENPFANGSLASLADGLARTGQFEIGSDSGGELHRTSGIKGTPLYMAPEVLNSEPASRRSDIYSMGALLYELCVGWPPHYDPLASLEGLRHTVTTRDAPPLVGLVADIDPRFAAVVERCLRRNPGERYASGEALRDALEQLADIQKKDDIPEGNPYRGLLPFEAEHRSLFFGRKSEIGTLVDRLRTEPFILVAADSGVGKSSLCRAGVLPLVEEGTLGGSRKWKQITLVPGRRPLSSLTSALGRGLGLDEEQLEGELRKEPAQLARILNRHIGDSGGVILFIDQMEELATIGDPQEVELVGEALAAVAGCAGGVRLLGTVRSDFLARLATVPEIGDDISRALYILRPLSPEKIREVVVGPAHKKGASFESEGLVNKIVASTASADGGLPLLQFALAELWEVKTGDVITANALESIGGVEGALARHADHVIGRLPAEQRPSARRILMSLVTIEGTRARRVEEELVREGAPASSALEALVRGRLLVARDTPEGAAYEVAHEALIKGWGTLRKWLEEHAEARAVKSRLEIAVADWFRLSKPREVLWSAKQVAETAQLEPTDIGPRESEFLAASRVQVAKQRRARRLVLACIPVLLLGFIASGARSRIEAREREQQAKRQAELAERLGQEIKDMEWLMRSSRQLRLHNLERERSIVRARMKLLQKQLLSYGDLSRGLAHYAIGRGHMALHEYGEALMELRQAMQTGYESAALHYALGFVLGKHFEQAMYEARLAGGGDWAKKQLTELEPRYLAPAIASLQQSRTMQHDAPQYLEALIAYYQRDYRAAVERAAAAQVEAPWYYEAVKLIGDVHLERALQARDSGRTEEAEREFAGAVTEYEAAATQGQSDAEIYEGLAEAWVRQIEMEARRGRPIDKPYAAAIDAIDRLAKADPDSIAAPLKRAYANMMTMANSSGGLSSDDRVRKCLESAEAVLVKQPGHPYASDAAANCTVFASEMARMGGKDPEPLLRKAISFLEPSVNKNPHFLWGMNDLGSAYIFLGSHLQLHGQESASKVFAKALEYSAAAAALDPTYLSAVANAAFVLAALTPAARSDQEVMGLLEQAEEWLHKCQTTNSQYQPCYDNFFQVAARASSRLLDAGKDPGVPLKRALESLADTRRLGGVLLDAEQHAALLHLVIARSRLRKGEDPEPALQDMQKAMKSCTELAKEDAMCRTLDAQGQWVRADWALYQRRSPLSFLDAALAKALLATQAPEPYPDAWQVLSETHLRRARLASQPIRERLQSLESGLAALEKGSAINKNHALGLATRGALLLERAKLASDPAAARTSAQQAVEVLERALELDPLLGFSYHELLEKARATSKPQP